jgi:Domain of unknown function (DUF4190)
VTEPPRTTPPQPPYPPYALPPYNTYAILSLVLAIFVLPPLGIYFGVKAKQQIAQTGERGIELANVGVICGWIFSIFFGVAFLAWCGFAILFFGAGASH